MKSRQFRFAWLITLITISTLACGLLSDIGNQIQGIEGTSQSMATGVKEGSQFLLTAGAAVTGISGSGLVETAKAYATEIDQSGLKETLQAVATQQGPSILATAQAIATNQGPSLLQTFQAAVTNDLPGILSTSQAALTQAANGQNNQSPTDIPLFPGETKNYFSSSEMVSFIASDNFANVLSFYKTKMPENGWSYIENGSIETNNVATLNYKKDSRQASVTLSINPIDSLTIVLISIQ